MHLHKVRNSKDQPVPLHAVPNPAQGNFRPQKAPQSMSLSHNQFPNHMGTSDIQEQFEPTYVKLDKQVSYVSRYRRVTAHIIHIDVISNASSHTLWPSNRPIVDSAVTDLVGQLLVWSICCLCAIGGPKGNVIEWLEISCMRGVQSDCPS